jgi:hypothetical protein
VLIYPLGALQSLIGVGIHESQEQIALSQGPVANHLETARECPVVDGICSPVLLRNELRAFRAEHKEPLPWRTSQLLEDPMSLYYQGFAHYSAQLTPEDNSSGILDVSKMLCRPYAIRLSFLCSLLRAAFRTRKAWMAQKQRKCVGWGSNRTPLVWIPLPFFFSTHVQLETSSKEWTRPRPHSMSVTELNPRSEECQMLPDPAASSKSEV